jgi:AcrR family transcriptional regulator
MACATARASSVPAETPRQREILAAARDLLAREGEDALTVARLAGALSIKAPSLYKHFAGKRQIEAGLIAQGFVELATALEAAGTLAGFGEIYRGFALREPALYRLMTAGPLPRDELPDGVEARAAAPLIAAAGGDPDRARAIWAFAHGMVMLELAGRFPPDADLDAAWRAGLAAFAT